MIAAPMCTFPGPRLCGEGQGIASGGNGILDIIGRQPTPATKAAPDLLRSPYTQADRHAMAEEATHAAATERKSDPLGTAIRQFGAVAGAVSLLGLAKDALEWQHDIATWIDAFRHFTRPIATFLFGWIPAFFHWPFPGWVKDYLTVGIVSIGATIRSLTVDPPSREDRRSAFYFVVITPLIWPILTLMLIDYFFVIRKSEQGEQERKGALTFASTFVYAAIIILINYVLIFSGARTGE